MSVTVVSCCYGSLFQSFRPRWEAAVEKLDPAPDAVYVADDRHHVSNWKHPQAFHLARAFYRVETDWAVICDIDDLVFTDALAGLDEVAADVWQLGFVSSDGESYVPPTLTNGAYLALDSNPYVGSSAIRVAAYNAVGGFPDVALQDWALWRNLARNGATFQSSGRTHFRYMRHPYARGEIETNLEARPDHLKEMETYAYDHA